MQREFFIGFSHIIPHLISFSIWSTIGVKLLEMFRKLKILTRHVTEIFSLPPLSKALPFKLCDLESHLRDLSIFLLTSFPRNPCFLLGDEDHLPQMDLVQMQLDSPPHTLSTATEPMAMLGGNDESCNPLYLEFRTLQLLGGEQGWFKTIHTWRFSFASGSTML